MHLVAMARAAGVLINWDNFSDISDVVPLMARLYPNSPADINHFQAAGGVPAMHELLKAACCMRTSTPSRALVYPATPLSHG
ncbi:dihydroxy-acid dehydratase [Shigella flexneri]